MAGVGIRDSRNWGEQAKKQEIGHATEPAQAGGRVGFRLR